MTLAFGSQKECHRGIAITVADEFMKCNPKVGRKEGLLGSTHELCNREIMLAALSIQRAEIELSRCILLIRRPSIKVLC